MCRSKGKRCERKCNYMEECYEIFHAHDHYPAGFINRKPFGGTTIVETILCGMALVNGIDAITMRDYPIIQAYVAWMAIIYVVVNLITDIIYHYLDPRVRLGGDGAEMYK